MAIYRVEKRKNYTVMSNHHLSNPALSLKAKGLLSLMLSKPDDWKFSIRGLSNICLEGVDAISGMIKELEEQGYIVRHRVRNENGKLGNVEYIVYENPTLQSKTKPAAMKNGAKAEPAQEKPEREKPIQETPAQLNTNKPNTKELSTDLSINQSENKTTELFPDEIDMIDQSKISFQKSEKKHPAMTKAEVEAVIDRVKNNIEYDALIQDYGSQRVDEVVDIISDILLSEDDQTIRIGKVKLPIIVVKSRLLKLDSMHIVYAFECINNTTTEIHNIKSYLLTTLYNAPSTMETYYDNKVNHDMAVGNFIKTQPQFNEDDPFSFCSQH